MPAVVWDGSKMVEIDDTVPFSTTMGSIFTKELSYYEKIEYDVPPRCLFQVVADITSPGAWPDKIALLPDTHGCITVRSGCLAQI